MESELNVVVIGVLGTLAGAVIGALLTYFFAVNLSKKEGFKRAGHELRQAFHEELVRLGHDENADPFAVLEEALPKHLAAVNEFRFHLSKSKRERFERAWCTYYFDDENLNIPNLEQYSHHLGGTELAKKNREVAMARINGILEFTTA